MTSRGFAGRIDRSIDSALALGPIGSPLTDDARRLLHEAPYRFVRITEDASAIEGLVNLRLAITHAFLDPREVGDLRARQAREAVKRLDALERGLANAQATFEAPHARLRYETTRYLDPPPPFTGAPLDEPGPDVLADLVERWERARDAPEPLLPWLARKAKQHLQFYRIGFCFPLYAARTRRINALLPRSSRENPGVLETFHALEQLGPVLDNFVFDRGPSAAFRDDVAVADLAFLLMQLADELVDNLVRLGGEGALGRLLAEHFDADARERVFIPFEDLDARSLFAAGIDPLSAVPKYGLTIDALVAVVAELRGALVVSVDRCADAAAVRADVRSFFHHCFATFLDELELPSMTATARLDRLPRAAVAWHFHRKNDEVMARWLALRARLLGLDPGAMPEVLARWGRLLASFQVFDDMKDLSVDLGHQPNYALAIAHRHHPLELEFLEKTYGTRELSLDRNDAMELAVHMPGTIRDCLELGRLLALSSFDWFLEYVADYRWRRNWLVRARSFHRAPDRDRPIESGALVRYEHAIDSGVPVIDAVFRYLAATERTLAPRELDDRTLGFVLDVVGYDHGLAILGALFPRVPTMYRFLNLRMRMTSRERAWVLRHLIATHPEASERALVGLRDATGSDALAHRIARGLQLPLPGRLVGQSLPT